MTVLQVAYPFASVGPDAVGGAEQVLTLLDEALIAADHRSIVIAAEGSAVFGRHVPLPMPDLLDEAAVTRAHAVLRETIARVLQEEAVDLVHLHGVDFHQYLPAAGVPVLVTLHLPPSFYPPEAFAPDRPDTWLHCVSASQRRACPAGTRLLDDVPNGVRLDRLGPMGPKSDYALGLGRMCPEKGWHLALDAARRAGRPLVLAGHVFPYPSHVAWFASEIRPRLDGDRRFVGAVGLADKARWLAAARCLLVPSLVPETSSLVAMEALASGTPVVAFRNGALPELIEHGKTGFLVDDVAGMARGIAAAADLDPADCRKAAEERFSSQSCVERYMTLYAKIAGSAIDAAGGMPTATRTAPTATAATSRSDGRPAHRPAGIDRVTGIGALEGLAEEWAALWSRGDASPFQHPAWAIPWARAFAPDCGAIVSWRGGHLEGLIPWFRGAPLQLLGAGISDDLDALVAPGADVEPLLACLLEGERAATFDDLPDTSPLRRAAAPQGWRTALEATTPCPVAELAGIERAEDLLSARQRANLVYARRRTHRAGLVRWSDPQDADGDALEAWFDLHGRQWAARGEPGVLAHPSIRAFHREAAPKLRAAGLLRLHALRLDGDVVGALYALASRAKTHFYLSAHAPDHATLSLGHQLVARAIDAAIAEGHVRFDFLRGQEPYKYAWGAVDHPKWRRTLERT